MNPDVWPPGTRLRDFRLPHGGLRINGLHITVEALISPTCHISVNYSLCVISYYFKKHGYIRYSFVFFTTYFNTYNNVSICGMDQSVLHAGRPYGGCIILHTSACTDIYPIYLDDSKRTCGIKWNLHISDGFVNLFTVYMPCDVHTAMYHHDLNNVLSSITMYGLQINVKYCIIGGDFNAGISRVNSMNTTILFQMNV